MTEPTQFAMVDISHSALSSHEIRSADIKSDEVRWMVWTLPYTETNRVPRGSCAISWACHSQLAGTVHRDDPDASWPTRHRARQHPIQADT